MSSASTASHELALAIVKATSAPVLLIQQDLSVVAANTSFYRTDGLEVGQIRLI